jgi:Flp pilus assembly protein TadG
MIKRIGTERGATLVEFAIAASVFFVAFFGVLEVARLLWTYNAIAEGVRQGARYASLNAINTANVQNVVVYGTPGGGTSPVAYGLTTAQVNVVYTNFGVNQGTVAVSVSGYTFSFLVLPDVFGSALTFPAYTVTMKGESAGNAGASCT